MKILKKKLLTATLPLCALIIALVMVFSSSAFVKAVGADDVDWKNYWDQTNTSDEFDGQFTDITVSAGWGARHSYMHVLDMTDFEMEIWYKDVQVNSKVCVGFTITQGNYFDSDGSMRMTFNLRRGAGGGDWINTNQFEITLNKTHDTTAKNITTDADLVRMNATDFSDWIKCTYKVLKNGSNYNITTTVADYNTSIVTMSTYTFVVAESTLNFNADMYMFVAAMDANTDITARIVSLKDSHTEALRATAEDKLTDYEGMTTSNAAADILAARNDAVSAVDALRTLDKAEYKERLEAKDVEMASIPDILDAIKALIDSDIAAYESATNFDFALESFVAADIDTAKTAKNAIRMSLFDMVPSTDADKASYYDRIATADYKVLRAEKTLLVMELEAAVNVAVDPEKWFEAEELSKLALADSFFDGLEDSEVSALAVRIGVAVADLESAFDLIEDDFSPYFFELYSDDVTVLDAKNVSEITLGEIYKALAFRQSMTDYLTDAFSKEDELSVVDISMSAIIDEKFESMILQANTFVDTDAKLKDYETFGQAKTILKQIDLNVLFDISQKKSEITTAYNTLKTKLEGSALYNFEYSGMSELKVTEDGIVTKGETAYPNRTNYDKAIDMTDAKFVFSITERTHVYDTVLGTSWNNICINFLPTKGQYKGGDNFGITIMLWQAVDSTIVQVYNNGDEAIAREDIGKLELNSDIIIRIFLNEANGSWVVLVNEARVVFSSGVMGVDKTVYKQGSEYLGYLSIGAFGDAGAINKYLLKQIGEDNFTSQTFTFPELNPAPTIPTTPDDDNLDENDGLPTGAIVAIIIGSVVVLLGGGFCLYWFVIRKKLSIGKNKSENGNGNNKGDEDESKLDNENTESKTDNN